MPHLLDRSTRRNMASLLDGFTFDDIEYLVEGNAFLKGYLKGYLAELRLEQYLEVLPGVSSVKKIPDFENRKGDFEVIYKGEIITIECKSLEINVTEDPVHDSWKGSVCIKTSCRPVEVNGEKIRTSYIKKGTFDILAISTFAVEGTWDFLFMENKYLPESIPGFIQTKLWVNPHETAGLTYNVVGLFDKILETRRQAIDTSLSTN